MVNKWVSNTRCAAITPPPRPPPPPCPYRWLMYWEHHCLVQELQCRGALGADRRSAPPSLQNIDTRTRAEMIIRIPHTLHSNSGLFHWLWETSAQLHDHHQEAKENLSPQRYQNHELLITAHSLTHAHTLTFFSPLLVLGAAASHFSCTFVPVVNAHLTKFCIFEHGSECQPFNDVNSTQWWSNGHRVGVIGCGLWL